MLGLLQGLGSRQKLCRTLPRKVSGEQATERSSKTYIVHQRKVLVEGGATTHARDPCFEVIHLDELDEESVRRMQKLKVFC